MIGRPGAIQPIALPGENVLLVDNTAYKLYQVAYLEPIPPSHPLVVEASAGAGLAAGATLAPFNTTAVLDLNEGQLGHFRSHVLDDIHVTMLQPQQLARYGLMNVNATINAFSRLEDPCDHLSELFVWEDDRPFLRVVNPTQYALTLTRVAFYGFKYVLAGAGGVGRGESLVPIKTFLTIREVEKEGIKYTIVPVGGWPL